MPTLTDHQTVSNFKRVTALANAPDISELRSLADRVENHGIAMRSWASIIAFRLADRKPLNTGSVCLLEDGCDIALKEAQAFVEAVRLLRRALP